MATFSAQQKKIMDAALKEYRSKSFEALVTLGNIKDPNTVATIKNMESALVQFTNALEKITHIDDEE